MQAAKPPEALNSRKDGPVPLLPSSLSAKEDWGPPPHLLEGLGGVRHTALWAGRKAEGLSCSWGITSQGPRGSALRKTCLVSRGPCDAASEHPGPWEPVTDISCLIPCPRTVSSGETGPASPHWSMWSPHWSSWADLKAQAWAAVPCRTVWAGGPDCLTWGRHSWVTVRLGVSLHCSTWVLWIHGVGVVTPRCHLLFSLDLLFVLLFSRSVVADSLWPHGLQHTRLPCPSPSPGACSNSCPLSRWCYPFHPLSSPSPPISMKVSKKCTDLTLKYAFLFGHPNFTLRFGK